MTRDYLRSGKLGLNFEALQTSVKLDALKLRAEIPPDTRNTTGLIAGDPLKGRSFWDRLTPDEKSRYG